MPVRPQCTTVLPPFKSLQVSRSGRDGDRSFIMQARERALRTHLTTRDWLPTREVMYGEIEYALPARAARFHGVWVVTERGLRPANVLGVSCTAGSRVPKPKRRGGCRERRSKNLVANCNRRDAVKRAMK